MYILHQSFLLEVDSQGWAELRDMPITAAAHSLLTYSLDGCPGSELHPTGRFLPPITRLPCATEELLPESLAGRAFKMA